VARKKITDLATLAIEAGQKRMSGADRLPCPHRGGFVFLEPCCIKADSHIACRAHATPLPCRAANGLECVFSVWSTQCGRVWFTPAMPRPCPAPTMPFFSRPRHRTAVERRPVGDRPAFGFFRLPRGVPWSCYQKHTNLRCRWPVWNQTTFVMEEEKSGSSTLQ
jgi:hypothetical protein